MHWHLGLGNTNGERRKNLGALIRTGAISLGGYRKGGIYGQLTCLSGKRMKIENRVFFKDECEAIEAGYRPCGACMPEEYRMWKSGQPHI
jgi:hypothetical protein